MTRVCRQVNLQELQQQGQQQQVQRQPLLLQYKAWQAAAT
jgi:hypothetical protein